MIRGGSAQDLATKLGWMGSVERRGLKLGAEPSASAPEVGEMIDVSVFSLQDMLTILGTYSGPKDGVWSTKVMDALVAWAGDRFMITVVPKADDPQTVSFRRQVFDRLQVEANAALARPAKPWYFWPLVITGSVAGIYLLVYIFSKAKSGGGTSEFRLTRPSKKKK
jgi:hypothetical protein